MTRLRLLATALTVGVTVGLVTGLLVLGAYFIFNGCH